MNTVQSPLLNEVNSYLMKRFGYKRPPAHSSPYGKTISAYKVKCDIYLRTRVTVEPWPPETLVIARIGFWKTRRGHGTDFLRFILRLARDNGYEHIGIELANTEASAFAEHYGFTYLSGGEFKNYAVPVAELLRNPKMR